MLGMIHLSRTSVLLAVASWLLLSCSGSSGSSSFEESLSGMRSTRVEEILLVSNETADIVATIDRNDPATDPDGIQRVKDGLFKSVGKWDGQMPDGPMKYKIILTSGGEVVEVMLFQRGGYVYASSEDLGHSWKVEEASGGFDYWGLQKMSQK
jgi:hypothetical protein